MPRSRPLKLLLPAIALAAAVGLTVALSGGSGAGIAAATAPSQSPTGVFPAAGAFIVVAGPNSVGWPEGIISFCSGTLIHPRVFLTAGHCVGPGAGPTGIPPWARLYVTLAANALDRSTWLPVTSLTMHPSMPPCPGRAEGGVGCDPTTTRVFRAGDPKVVDLGFAILSRAADVAPAELAPPRTLGQATAKKTPMAVVGYGFPTPASGNQPPAASTWSGLRHVRYARLARLLNDAWATWRLPGHVCYGDSGAGTYLPLRGKPLLVAVASDGGADCASKDVRVRIDSPRIQKWIRQTLAAVPPAG